MADICWSEGLRRKIKPDRNDNKLFSHKRFFLNVDREPGPEVMEVTSGVTGFSGFR